MGAAARHRQPLLEAAAGATPDRVGRGVQHVGVAGRQRGEHGRLDRDPHPIARVDADRRMTLGRRDGLLGRGGAGLLDGLLHVGLDTGEGCGRPRRELEQQIAPAGGDRSRDGVDGEASKVGRRRQLAGEHGQGRAAARPTLRLAGHLREGSPCRHLRRRCLRLGLGVEPRHRDTDPVEPGTMVRVVAREVDVTGAHPGQLLLQHARRGDELHLCVHEGRRQGLEDLRAGERNGSPAGEPRVLGLSRRTHDGADLAFVGRRVRRPVAPA